MPINLLFWIIYIIAVIFCGWVNYPFERRSSAWLAIIVLIFLLGWRVFGFVIQDGGPGYIGR